MDNLQIRYGFYGSLILLIAGITGIIGIAEESQASVVLSTFNQGKGTLSADLRIIYRHEFWDWFEPQVQPNDNNSYDYFFTRSLAGLKLTLPYLQAYLQAQDVHMWSIPDDAVSNPPAGPLGGGGLYYLHGGQRDYSSTIIRQAYLEIPRCLLSGLSLRGGRFDYCDGLEVSYDNPKVNWLKEMRLGERLLGPFLWSSFNRSFDGFKVTYDRTPFDLTSMASHPTQGGFENDAQQAISDIDLATFTLTVKYDQLIPNTEGRCFYFYYADDRNVPKADNTPVGSRLNQGEIRIHTLGAHWLSTAKLRRGIGDALFWGTYQTGDWGMLDHGAWAATVEVGYQFVSSPWTPWIRAGYFVSSGDSNPSDNDHETFYQLLPTVRKYALFIFYSQMNNEDAFLQAIVKPTEKMAIRGDCHFLRLHEGDDRWYQGSGPTKKDGRIFGYTGRPSFGDQTLGTLLDVTVLYKVNAFFSTTFYFGHVFGNEVIENVYPRGKDANMGYVELTVTF